MFRCARSFQASVLALIAVTAAVFGLAAAPTSNSQTTPANPVVLTSPNAVTTLAAAETTAFRAVMHPAIGRPTPLTVPAVHPPHYTVQPGDTLIGITRCFGARHFLPTARASHLGNPSLIMPGQRLTIIGATRPCSPRNRADSISPSRSSTARTLAHNPPESGTDTCTDNRYGVNVRYHYDSSRIHTALRYACSKVGGPYVWGANGPTAFDCSGLTQHAMAAAGVTIPRVSRDQFNTGQPVSSSELRAGDLVFFYSPVAHVAMYLGDGYIVHAANPSAGIKISTLTQQGSYAGARRLITPPATPTASAAAASADTVSTHDYEGMNHQELMLAAGIPAAEYAAADFIMSHESGWCATIANGERTCPPTRTSVPAHKAYGMCQSLPATKMATAGNDWMTNPITQLRWCNDYAHSRYGSWSKARSFWQAHSWW